MGNIFGRVDGNIFGRVDLSVRRRRVVTHAQRGARCRWVSALHARRVYTLLSVYTLRAAPRVYTLRRWLD